jgi:hypothetical protein
MYNFVIRDVGSAEMIKKNSTHSFFSKNFLETFLEQLYNSTLSNSSNERLLVMYMD